MAAKAPEPTEQPTEQPTNEPQPLPMPDSGGTYIRNQDGSLTKVESNDQ